MSDQERRIMRGIGLKLRQARALHGLTQGELGGTLGITFQQVQKYENAGNHLSAAKLKILADRFQLPVDYFYDACAAPAPPSRRVLHLFEHLRRIEQEQPREFIALCRLITAMAGTA